MSADQARKEECREECLRFLVDRAVLKHASAAVQRGVKRAGFEFTESEIETALHLLCSLGFVEKTPHVMGGTLFYQATAQGILELERL